MKDIWKKFDEAELTHSSVHHLMAINILLQQNGYSRAVDISNYLNISRSSVSITVSKLKDKGFIQEDRNRFLNLSEKGIQMVNSVLAKRRIVAQFFREVLNLSESEAEIEACKVEHLLSEPTGQKLLSFMGFYLSQHPAASQFREELKSFNFQCVSTQSCQFCEIECFFRTGHG